MPYATVNPATGLTEKTFDFHSPDEVEALVPRAVDAFADYRTTSYAERARHLVNTADLFEGEAPEMARIVTTEMGKTFAAARAEASKCAMACGGSPSTPSPSWPTSRSPRRRRVRTCTTSRSGPVLGVMPWNFPLWQVIRFVAPALMVGNVVLLKHASNVPQTALLLEDAFVGPGFHRAWSPTCSWRARTSRRSLRIPGSPP